MQDKKEAPHQNYPGSVLLSDHVEEFVSAGYLIVPEPEDAVSPYVNGEVTFKDGQLERAKYNFRLGKKYFQAGKFGDLTENNSTLLIGAYEQVFIESYEVFKLPENIIGVYDLRISYCLDGLGLQTGLQLDPCYYGRIFSAVFNFSGRPVRIYYKKQFGSIHFIYTTSDTERKARSYAGLNKCFSLNKILTQPPGTGGETLWAEIQEIRREIEKDHEKLVEARSQTQNANMVFLAVVGLVLTAISAILVPEAIGRIGGTSLWTVAIIGAVVVAVVWMLLSFVKSLFKRENTQSSPEQKRGNNDSNTTKE